VQGAEQESGRDMSTRMTEAPEKFIEDFFASFTEQLMADGADPGQVVDRYYTPDIVQLVDGVRVDRERLIAHVRPVRRNLAGWRFEVHEALLDEHRLAARMTIHGRMRTGRSTVTEVHLFGELAPDGRIRRTHQLTRPLPAEAPAEAPAEGEEEQI
jgi:hypothetical protein